MVEFDLETLGLRPETRAAFQPLARHGLELGRISTTHRKGGVLLCPRGRLQVAVLHKVRKRQEAGELEAHLTVGDWVAFEPRGEPITALVHEILPRHSLFVRKAAGLRPEPQPMAANVDHAFIVVGLDSEPSPRRLERFLTMIHRAGARASFVFTKADLVEDPSKLIEENLEAGPATPYFVVSSETGLGLDTLALEIGPGVTIALLGISGAGKSTLVNALFGETMMQTGAVRGRDQKGRHTTSERQLLVVPTGGLIIDGPGIREIEPWDAEDALEETFEDVAEWTAHCRFSNCRHDTEPGCAVLDAVKRGALTDERRRAFVALRLEAEQRSKKGRR